MAADATKQAGAPEPYGNAGHQRSSAGCGRVARMGRGPGKQGGGRMVKQCRKLLMPAVQRKRWHQWQGQGEGICMRHAKRTVLQMVQRRFSRRVRCCLIDGNPCRSRGGADFHHVRWPGGQGMGNRRCERIEQDRQTSDPDLQPFSS